MSVGQEMSSNGHETKAQMASRNLGIYVDHLDEMRWMIVNACGTDSAGVKSYDEGVAKLREALAAVIDGAAKPAMDQGQWSAASSDDGYRKCRICDAMIRDNGALDQHMCSGSNDDE